MCGVAGVFRFGGLEDDRAAVRAMAACLSRRGPDDEGFERDGPLTVGHRRLSILDLTSGGHQPMRSTDGRLLVAFNGEIYNHDEVRRELGVARDALRSTSDTEILLLAWERWGAACLDHLAGQWAFAMYDARACTLWLARDRFGEKPLFFHCSNDAIHFASSIPALLAVPGMPRSLDADAISEYVTLRYLVSPRTVIAGIQKVPPGHVMRVAMEGVDVQRWYAPRFRAAPARTAREAVEEFGQRLTTAARRCMVSDVPVGLLLSDGIDSNAIRAALSDAGGVRSFTYALSSSESGLTRAHPDGDKETLDLRVTPADRLECMLPSFAAFGEPVGDGAALATWLLIRRARDQATVFLCGHGGDEVLGGYRLSQDRFRLATAHTLSRLPEDLTRPLLDRTLNGRESFTERLTRMRVVPASRAPEAARYLIHRPLPVPDVGVLLGRPLTAADGYLATVDRLYASCARGATDLDRIQEVMLQTFLSENILSFADAMAMDSSAELRMPFLDRDLVDFVFSLPPSLRVGPLPGRTNTKLILRAWARGRVAPDVLARRKRGFPFGNLPELLETNGAAVRDRVLGSAAVRAVLPGAEAWLARPSREFRSSREGTLWALLALGIWCEAHGVR